MNKKMVIMATTVLTGAAACAKEGKHTGILRGRGRGMNGQKYGAIFGGMAGYIFGEVLNEVCEYIEKK